jgi:nicotinate-nucleotide--dimethylbenzimidazole phosphoribosyltransferase
MTKFDILPLNTALHDALAHKILHKTKPQGALGELEAVALQVGLIQQSLTPMLTKPTMLVFAGDHGIAQSGVSPYPQAVTAQMVMNFLAGGAAINVFSRQVGMQLRVIDAGVNYSFASDAQLIHAKIDMGTANFLNAPAMTLKQCDEAIAAGARIANDELVAGCNVIGFGEMGIGNTSSASCLMSKLTGMPIAECVGRGTGLDDAGVANKTRLLTQALAYHAISNENPHQVLATLGGYEIAMMVGAMLASAEQKATLLIDGFIATAALLVASKLQPNILAYCIYAHRSGEHAHQKLLNYLRAKPLLDLGLRLGEGTGAVLVYPLVQAAVNFLNEMASFESAGVSERTAI